MKPLLHAKISVKKFGGKIEDYIEIHNFIDSTKEHIPDSRHRIILHNSFGIFLAEKMFGKISINSEGQYIRLPHITNSNGKDISIKDIAEQHVLDDLGHIPSLSECFNHIKEVPAKFVGGKLSSAILSGKLKIID